MSEPDRLLETAILTVGVIVAILVGIWLVASIRSRYRGHEDPAAQSQQMLTHMRDLYRQGDLSEEEYRSIKGRLMGLDRGEESAKDDG